MQRRVVLAFISYPLSLIPFASPPNADFFWPTAFPPSDSLMWLTVPGRLD